MVLKGLNPQFQVIAFPFRQMKEIVYLYLKMKHCEL
jgi:hypothetical protein